LFNHPEAAMRAPLLLVSLGVAALLAGCQATAPDGTTDDLPSNDPTATSTELADGY
jgi:hypothetical protein